MVQQNAIDIGISWRIPITLMLYSNHLKRKATQNKKRRCIKAESTWQHQVTQLTFVAFYPKFFSKFKNSVRFKIISTLGVKKYLTLTDYLLSFRRVMVKNYFTLGHSDFNLKSFQKSNLS